MEFTFNDDGRTICVIYFSKGLNLDTIEKEYSDYDSLSVIYPQDVCVDIYNKYKAVMKFIEFGGSWGNHTQSIEMSLLESPENLLQKMSKNTRYEVKRALGRDELCTEVLMDVSKQELNEFLTFYNAFADLKNLGHIGEAKIRQLATDGKYAITKCYGNDGMLLVEHTYYLDKTDKRVMLATSSSLYRKKEYAQYKNLIGRANRMLHYQDMLYFKAEGYQIYDFNGISDFSEETKAIADFKRGFGGEVITYQSGFVVPCRKIKLIDSKLKNLMKEQTKEIIIYGFGEIGKYVRDELEHLAYTRYKILDNYAKSSEKSQYLRDEDLENIGSEQYLLLMTLQEQTFLKLETKLAKFGYFRGRNLITLLF